MARMKLGSYTFDRNPSIYQPPDLLTPKRHVASVQTYDSVAVFSWGVTIIGKKIRLEMGYMQETQYQAIKTLLEADTATTFDPDDGWGKTYNVEIMDFDGKFHYKLRANGAENIWRSSVYIDLLILSEIT